MKWGGLCWVLAAGCFSSSGGSGGFETEGHDAGLQATTDDAGPPRRPSDDAGREASLADGGSDALDAAAASDASMPDAAPAMDAAAAADAAPDAASPPMPADACTCFATGQWAVENLSPCIFTGTNRIYLYSSWLDTNGAIQCGGPYLDDMMPPAPEAAWSQSTFWVDCTGQFELCITIKAGDVDDPDPSDCEIVSRCIDVDYQLINAQQTLPELAAWSSPNSECAREFYQGGGYGEMTVRGTSDACGPVDDGMGSPLVFHRTNYCPPTCLDTPDTPECRDCTTGGSGAF